MLKKIPRRRLASLTTRSTGLLAALVIGFAGSPAAANPHYPVTGAQREAARQVADAGVPLSELAPNAPDTHTVRPGDTLWEIAGLFLRSPWRWPELWGMNQSQIANPHLIYPGQTLVLVKSNGRARLQAAQTVSGGGMPTVVLSPKVRSSRDVTGPISSIPAHLIQPFLNDAVVLSDNELASAPTIVAGAEGRVLLGRGDQAYVRGDMAARRDWRVFRTPQPLTDPETGAVLGFEAAFVGAAELVSVGSTGVVTADQPPEITPSTIRLTRLRQEAGRGDRLALPGNTDDSSFAPRAPAQPVKGSVVSIYGGGLNAGRYQVVALNRGRADGMQRGHVLALSHQGRRVSDGVNADKVTLVLPDERHGYLMVFRVFDRVSYALIMAAQQPVVRGDHFTQP